MVVPKKVVSAAVGIDLGLKSFAVFSDSSRIENPRNLKKSEETLKSIQFSYSKHKGIAAKGNVSTLHRKVTNQRNNFLHKASTMAVNKYGLIGYEDLNIKEMTQGLFSKSIHDATWGKFD
jgi:putative transposase